MDALKKANDYTFQNAGIAILIANGKGNGKDVTPEAVGTMFVKEVRKRGEKARYFYYNADWDGMTVEYHIGYSSLGPWNADKAAAHMSKAIEFMKADKRIHK